jgi:molybdopterin-guanine dinucleotide biosynthesis protein A
MRRRTEGVGKPTPSLFLETSFGTMITDVTAVLLAGGKSRRMGQDKRFLSIGGETLYERTLAVLRALFKTVVVVIAQDSPPLQAEVPILRDLIPECGSLGGLYTGLKRAVTPFAFTVACDMPFLDPRTIGYFTQIKDDADVVMAKLQNGLQPMHALYHQRCLPMIETLIQTRQLKIQQLAAHPSLRVRLVTPDELDTIDPTGRSFCNVNTPAELEAARSFHAQASKPSSS